MEILYSKMSKMQNQLSAFWELGHQASILFRILNTETVKNDVFSNEWICDNLTDELEWWQVQSNTPRKGKCATPNQEFSNGH